MRCGGFKETGQLEWLSELLPIQTAGMDHISFSDIQFIRHPILRNGKPGRL